MSFRGIVGGAIGLVVVALAIALAVQVFANSIVVERLDRIMAGLRQSGAERATYQSAKVDLFSRSVTVTGLDIRLAEKDEIRIAEAVAVRYDIFNARQPAYGQFDISGITVRAGNGSRLSALFRQFGATQVAGRIQLAFRANHQLRIVDIDQLDIDLTDTARLQVSGKMGNWNRKALLALIRAFAGDGTQAFRGTGLEIHFATLTYQDRGFVNRYLKFLAAREDRKLGRYKRDMLRDLRKARRALKGDRLDRERKLLEAMIEFIRKPGILVVKLEPDNPVKVAEIPALDDPVRLRSRLRLTLSRK